MLAEMSIPGPTPNTLTFAPLADPKLAPADTLLAITSLQTAFETHGLLDQEMIGRGSEQLGRKPQPNKSPSRMRLGELPVEIHEAILDHLFGVRASTSSSAVKGSQATRGWSNVLRHPRRKQLSNLGLVSPLWRRLVQERLYRHIKVKGTKAGLHQCGEWFLLRPHLQSYVKHIEVWVPVWEKKSGSSPSYSPAQINPRQIQSRAVVTTIVNANTTSFEETNNISLVYQLASHNATMDEILACVKCLFPDSCILTLEGGHCKKPPMIQLFRNNKTLEAEFQKLPVLANIRTLVMKGAWNIIREERHFQLLAAAVPNVREWHCTFAKPKSKSYMMISKVLQHLPPTLTHVNICLESFYDKAASSAHMWNKVYPARHICHDLAAIAPQLEALTYTGRICGNFFSQACRAAEQLRGGSKLKSLDLVVKNCCRRKLNWNDGTGICNWTFIQAFEGIVVAGVQSLDILATLKHLRIRFIDLDSPCALLNPYFQLSNNQCTGIWNEDILALLPQVRPGAQYVQLSDDLGIGSISKDGFRVLDVTWPKQRPTSIKTDSYASIADPSSLVGAFV